MAAAGPRIARGARANSRVERRARNRAGNGLRTALGLERSHRRVRGRGHQNGIHPAPGDGSRATKKPLAGLLARGGSYIPSFAAIRLSARRGGFRCRAYIRVVSIELCPINCCS